MWLVVLKLTEKWKNWLLDSTQNIEGKQDIPQLYLVSVHLMKTEGEGKGVIKM